MTTTTEADVTEDRPETAADRTPIGNLPWIAAGLVVISGVVAGVAVDQTLKVEGFFQVPPEFKRSHVPPPPEMLPQFEAAELATRYKNSAWTFGLAGLLLGIGGGAAAGVWRKSISRILAGSGTGALLGAVAGIAGGVLAMFVFQTIGFVDDDSVAYRAIAVHASGWGLVAVGVGAAAAAMLRRDVPVGAMFGGVIGAAVLSAVIYAPAAATLFPLEDSTGQLAPTGTGNRILWTTVTALLMGLAMASTLTPPKNSQATKSPAKSAE